MNQEELNTAIAARPAVKITPERIKEVIVGEAYHRLTDTLTVCVLTLANGFTVTGESACASPENYDQQIGEAIARKQAKSKVWGFEGYLLRERLTIAASALVPPRADMPAYVGTKCINARPMTRGDYCTLRGWDVPDNENPEDDGYLVEYTDKIDQNVPGYKGYISWSPADVFERAYELVGGGYELVGGGYAVPDQATLVGGVRLAQVFDFGLAIHAMKHGKRVARAGWNGKGMWLKLVPTELADAVAFQHAALDALPWIGMKTADDKFVPWLASQTDVLAKDWSIVE